MSRKNYIQKNFFLIFLIFQLFNSLKAESFVFDCTRSISQLRSHFPTKIFVKTIDIQADFHVDQDELFYLIDIVPMSHISIEQLEQTVFYLQKKELFSKIEVMYDTQNCNLVFGLQGLFVLTHCRLHGSLIGKEKYKSAYIMDAGEGFEEKKHRYSLKKMKEMFFHAGCFKAVIEDKISYDPTLKTVKVDLYLQKGPQFSIGNCTFDLTMQSEIPQDDIVVIRKHIEKILIKKLFKIKYSKDFIEKTVQKLQQFLTKQGFSQPQVLYEEVLDYNHNQIDLKFNISLPEKREFIFWGNHFFTKENFLENISMYGKYSWNFPGAILADEIESMYKAKGFWDVKVEVKEEDNKTFCMIHEGKRAFIQSVEIKDNFNISEKILVHSCCSFLQEKPFDRESFSQAMTALKNIYMQHGFWDMKVVKEEFVPLKINSENQNGVNFKIVITLDEGKIRKLRAIEIEGYPELVQEKIFQDCIHPQQFLPFHHQWIAMQKSWLTNYFKDRGHSKVIVDHEYAGDFDAMTLRWKIHLDEKQVYFGKVIVTGNAQIPFKYLQRELALQQGQVWDKKKIEQSLTNLRNLELFDTVHMYAHKQVDDQGQIPVGLKLIAADKYEVRTRVGGQQVGKDFSLQQGFSYKAGGTLFVNNPFKYGDRVVFDADFTRFYENFSLQYLMPWLFERPIRSQIKIYGNHYLQPLYIGSDVSIYNAYQQGILFGLQEKHESINIGMSVGLEFKGVKKADIEDIEISIDYNPLFFNKKFAFLFLEPSLMWTNVDNVVNPRTGSNILLSLLAMADLENQTSLFKFLGEYALYVPFTSKVVGAIRTRVGHIFNQYYQNIIPIDRFYLGGANTIRGYERDYCPPLGRLTHPVYAPNAGLPVQADNLWRYVNQGGRTMFNCNFELRFPVYAQLEGAVYFDSGVLIKDSVQDIPNNFLGGVGFGFRYNTPIGPLRFDLAFQLDRKYPDFQPPYVWYLTLGQAF